MNTVVPFTVIAGLMLWRVLTAILHDYHCPDCGCSDGVHRQGCTWR